MVSQQLAPIFKNRPLFIIIGFVLILIFFTWQNNSIMITKSEYCNPKIPDEFNDFVIAHISDLHNKRFGRNQSVLLNKLTAINPDIIIITGDLIDRRKFNLDIAMEFITGAIKIAPVYYVSGNHEAWSGDYPAIKESLAEAGVTILDHAKVELFNGNSSISLLGVGDPAFLTSSYMEETNVTTLTEQLQQWSTDEFKILLSHRPELFDLYSESNMDLIFTGHAHGGQIRIPFIGGLVAPDQGLFPKYTSGSHTKDSSTMFVSRGLGNSIFPLRIFNQPEIVVVVLNNQTDCKTNIEK